MKTIGSKYQVYTGTAAHTSGGLVKSDIVRVKKGVSDITGENLYKYVSKVKRKAGQNNAWILSVQAAKRELGLQEGFITPRKRGGTQDQRDLYTLSMEIYES